MPRGCVIEGREGLLLWISVSKKIKWNKSTVGKTTDLGSLNETPIVLWESHLGCPGLYNMYIHVYIISKIDILMGFFVLFQIHSRSCSRKRKEPWDQTKACGKDWRTPRLSSFEVAAAQRECCRTCQPAGRPRQSLLRGHLRNPPQQKWTLKPKKTYL